MKTLDKKLEEQLIANLIVQNIQEVSSEQWFYTVIYYSDRDDSGSIKEWDERRWMYNRNEMQRIHRYIRRTLKEHFKVDYLYFTLERHQGKYERIEEGKYLQYGDLKKGKYHSNILISPISDYLLENPHSKLSRLWDEGKRMGKPIKSLQYNQNLIELKIDLINACLRKVPMVNRYAPSVKTQVLESAEDLWYASGYTLKGIHRQSIEFSDVIDWDNSDIKH